MHTILYPLLSLLVSSWSLFWSLISCISLNKKCAWTSPHLLDEISMLGNVFISLPALYPLRPGNILWLFLFIGDIVHRNTLQDLMVGYRSKISSWEKPVQNITNQKIRTSAAEQWQWRVNSNLLNWPVSVMGQGVPHFQVRFGACLGTWEN